jgi:DNA invertase Pin-like site-specific DNA recombinase
LLQSALFDQTPYRKPSRFLSSPVANFVDVFGCRGIYIRVSTDGQTTANQRRELEAVAGRVGIYEDAGISGAKGRDKRPGLDRLLKDATARKINMIAAWSVDRLGRSLQDLVGFLGELQAVGCNLYLQQQALDTTTPSGRAMFQMCACSPNSRGQSSSAASMPA